jgi:hypothetical protein
LDIVAASRSGEASTYAFVFDDEECGCFGDLELVQEVGSLFACDLMDCEGVVVAASLQDLRQEAFCATGATVADGGEDDESRALGGRLFDCGCQFSSLLLVVR